jgi:hypothetical protein
MNKRHFTVVEKNGKEHGLYVSSTPSSAAKKAVSKLCSSNKNKKVEFYLREITQGSKKKTYGPYLGEMKKLKKPIELEGRVIRYETKVYLNRNMKGGSFRCSAKAEKRIIGELCDEDTILINKDKNGQFIDKLRCEDYCYDKKFKSETSAWKELFVWCSTQPSINKIYCKGGSALGFVVLKLLFDKYYTKFNNINKNINANFIKFKFNEFVRLNLIKDCDFTVFMNETDKNKFIEEAKNLKINNEGETISIFRFQDGLKIGDDYLFELSVKNNEKISDLELPLTNIKFEVNKDNIDSLFEIIDMFIRVDNIDFSKIKKILDNLLVEVIINGDNLVNSIKDGLYVITEPEKISKDILSPELMKIIDDFLLTINNSTGIEPMTIKQFLITHLSEPDRLFIRFLQKNIQKSENIINFFNDNNIEFPNWLMNEKVFQNIKRIIDLFLDYLNKIINSEIEKLIPDSYFDENKDNTKNIKSQLKKFMENMNILFRNINFSRLHNDKVDKTRVEKLFPTSIFKKLKSYSLKLKDKKNKIYLNSIKANKMQLERKHNLMFNDSKKPFKYSFYLNGQQKYTNLLRYFLDNIYNKKNDYLSYIFYFD